MSDSDDNDSETEVEHTPIFYTGSLPGPKGQVAKWFHTAFPMETQRTHATDLFHFLNQDSLQPLELNSDNIPRAALISVPSSNKVRLVYGMGFGSRMIRSSNSEITGKYVMLSGEGGLELGTPNVLTIPVDF